MEQDDWNVCKIVCSKIAVASVGRHCQGDALSKHCFEVGEVR